MQTETNATERGIVSEFADVDKRILCGLFEPRHGICTNVACATSKGSDQPALTRSLIRAFASLLNILRILSY